MTEGQEPNGSDQPGAGQTQVVQPSVAEQLGQAPQSFDTEYVKTLRAEAADYRKKLRDLEARVKIEEEAKLSEAEKIQKRLTELERQSADWQRQKQEYVTEYEVKLAASRLGIVDPDAAYRLLDPAALEYDEEGKPTNIEAALTALKAKRPYLSGVGGASAANPQAQHGGRLTIEDVKKMSQDEINRRWEEVSAVLSGNK